MGRRKVNKIHNYFTKRPANVSECNHCQKIIKGCHAGNLSKHLRRAHPEAFAKFLLAQEFVKQEPARENGDWSPDQPSNSTSNRRKEKNLMVSHRSTTDSDNSSSKKKKIVVSMDTETFFCACTELVTVNGRPFSIVEDSGFRKIVDPLLQALNATIDSKKVASLVDDRAGVLRAQLKSEVSQRFVCVKVDVVSRLERTVLGLNVQFVSQGQLCLRMLGVFELVYPQSTEHVGEVITKGLQEYDVGLAAVYCVVLDTGSALVQAARFPSEATEEDAESPESICAYGEEEEEDMDGTKRELVVVQDEETGIFLSDFLPLYLDDRSQGVDCLEGTCCPARMLHLAVLEALHVREVSGVLASVRHVMSKLRHPDVVSILRLRRARRPLLDIETRWFSTYRMLERLQELRELCEELAAVDGDLFLGEDQWLMVSEIRKVLEPAKTAALRLQEENATPGEFYLVWMLWKLETAKCNSSLSDAFLSAIQGKEEKFLEDGAVVAGIYLDVRVNIILSATQKQQAKAFLKKLARKIVDASNRSVDGGSYGRPSSAFYLGTDGQSSVDDLETLLQRAERNGQQRAGLHENEDEDLEPLFQAFEANKRLSRDADVVQWWFQQPDSLLKQVAEVALSLPAAQIREQKYNEAIVALSNINISIPNTRAALSLLAYCHYYSQNYEEAASYYKQLTTMCPSVEDYKLYYTQSLYKACLHEEAMKVSCQFDNPKYQGKIVKLQAAIKYGEDDLPGAKSLVDQCPPNDPDTEINLGCLLYKEGRYEEACDKFKESMQLSGYKPDLSYNIALCYYQMKQFAPSLKHIADIIEKGIRKHPELSVGMTTEGIEVRSVGNTITLHETALIEAFNLKAAVEYQLKNYDAAKEALTDMPPRSEEELDAVTLHNQALINMDLKPTEGFEKLQFLLQQNTYPSETFGNLLLLYSKYEYYDLAADILAENAHLTYKYLTPYLYDFLDALMTQQTSPDEAYRKFDDIAAKHTELLRKLTKQVQDARQNHDEEHVRHAINDYEETLERYIPVLMAQAKIYWELDNYSQVEKIFRKSVEFCNDHDVWKLNVAHVLFMQENKFKEATGFYEPIVKKHYDNILSVSPVVLANLCVSYIMTSQNEEAEELMRKIEKEEEHIAYEDPDKKIYHLCIVNLVIGTLYCAKGNYEFGILRIIKSLENFSKKLSSETWFYAKRCFLSMIENQVKHVITVQDRVIQDCIQFLEHCEAYGRNIKARIEQPLMETHLHPGKNTVTYEARLMKALLLELVY